MLDLSAILEHLEHNSAPSCSKPDRPESLYSCGSSSFGTLGTLGTLENSRPDANTAENVKDARAAAEAASSDCAAEGLRFRFPFALDPEAGRQILALAREKAWTVAELLEAFDHARTLPAETQRQTFGAPVAELGTATHLATEIDHDQSIALDACDNCGRLLMEAAYVPGSRRRFWWRCTAGHQPLEVGRGTERFLLAPSDCQEWEQWQPGTRS